METIIGLGNCGCSIAKKFIKYPQYEVFLVDTEPHNHRRSLRIHEEDSPEKYEKTLPELHYFFKDVQGPILFILSASGYISGASLMVLRHLSDLSTTIMCIKSNIDLLSDIQKMQQKIVLNVLQEYARSNLFEKIYIIDNEKVEEIIGDFTVFNYYDKVNELIGKVAKTDIKEDFQINMNDIK